MAGLQIHQCLECSICWVFVFFWKAFYSLPLQLPDFFFFFSIFSLNFSALSVSLTDHLILLPLVACPASPASLTVPDPFL